MKSIVFLSFLLVIMILKNSFANPIEKIFPDAFSTNPGINIKAKNISGVEGYAVDEFSENEKNRNHWDLRGENTIQFLIMHYTVCDFPSTLNLFTANLDSNRVSAHYIITQKEENHKVIGGIPLRVVPENKRAWHAGVSSWGGIKNLNASSIGIENVNKGFIGEESAQPQWFPFDPNQIMTLGKLSKDIIVRYKISPQNVVGHADIAPTRKQDPGMLFPWEELYRHYGIGAWLSKEEQNPSYIMAQYTPKEPLPKGISEAFFIKSIRNYGYDCPESAYVTPEHYGIVKAFKSHFSHNQYSESYTPIIDQSTMLWGWGLEAKYRGSEVQK